jgi:hypothetical protein
MALTFLLTTVHCFFEQRSQRRIQRIRDNFGTFCRGVNAIVLNRARYVNEILVEHGNDGGFVLGGKVAEDRVEGTDVVAAVVRRKGDAGDENFDLRVLQGRDDGVEIVPRLLDGQSAQSVVAAEFDDDDIGMERDDRREVGDRIFRGCAAGAAVQNFIAITVLVELLLKKVGIGLPVRYTVTGRDTVAKTNQNRLRRSAYGNGRHREQKRNEKPAANVHKKSVLGTERLGTKGLEPVA